MKEKEHYVIRIGESIVKVSQEVYYAYYQMQRQEQWQEEKKKDHNVLSYDALDDQETLGIENVVDVAVPKNRITMVDLSMRCEAADSLKNIIRVRELKDVPAPIYDEISKYNSSK